MKRISAGAATAICLACAAVACPRGGDGQTVTQPSVRVSAVAPAAGNPGVATWPNGRFVYELDPEVAADPARSAAFEAACRALVDGSALRCVPRGDPGASADPDWVYVVSGPGNHSMIGRQGGRQQLSIRAWNNPVKIAHEIKHALGWAHEHQHPQRDRYVEILFDNIPPRWHGHFQQLDLGNEGPYDFGSIMHYYPSDFALPARRAIRARDRYRDLEARMGQRDHLPVTDLEEIRAVYGRAASSRGASEGERGGGIPPRGPGNSAGPGLKGEEP